MLQNLISAQTGLHDMPITQITEMTLSSAKKVLSLLHDLIVGHLVDISVCVSPAVIAELKRIVRDSEIMKYFLIYK